MSVTITREQILETAVRQSAIDLHCAPEDFLCRLGLVFFGKRVGGFFVRGKQGCLLRAVAGCQKIFGASVFIESRFLWEQCGCFGVARI